MTASRYLLPQESELHGLGRSHWRSKKRDRSNSGYTKNTIEKETETETETR